MRVHHLTDPDDPAAAPFRDIPTYDRREETDTFVVESRQCVRRLIDSGRFPIRALLCTPPALRALAPMLETLIPQPVVCEAEVPIVKAITGFGFHRGCLAIADRGSAIDPTSLAERATTLVALDAVSDPDNVGAIFRNALAFEVDGVLLSPTAGDPLYRKATRVSVGATLSVPFARSLDFATDLAMLGSAGFERIALTPDGAPLPPGHALRTHGRRVLLVGSEADGLGAVARAAADRLVAIPMAAASDSLNVATATGIALYAMFTGRS